MTRDELKLLLDDKALTDGMVAIQATGCPKCGASQGRPCHAEAGWAGQRTLWKGRRAHPLRMTKLYAMIARLDLLT